jgi:DNA mismatch endonuclease (patch repair protein)
MEKQALGISYPQPSTPAATAVMRGNRKRDTRPEVRLRSALHRRGLRFRVQRQVAAGSIRVRPDVVFGPAKAAVFVDGCFWHGCPDHGTIPRNNRWYWKPKLERNRRRDKVVDEALHLAGWSVVRIWEHEGASEAVAKVMAALGRES